MFKDSLLIGLGWFFVLLGGLGVLLPILPTTPFLLIALWLFAKSSPKFHQMLLDNRWFGDTLKQWNEHKVVTRNTKLRAITLVVISISASIWLVRERMELQIMLFFIAVILIAIIWHLKEQSILKVELENRVNK